MIDTPHPRPEAEAYRCWPMLDFQSGVDDHLTSVTHIIRGIDLQDSAKRQQFVYDYFGWEYPEVVHWGNVQVDAYDVQLSTSTLKEKIDAGDLDGWDDPRAPTLASLRRRGIRGEAVVEALAALGTSTSNVDLAMSSVYAANRDLVDDDAERYFLVRDGERFEVDGGPDAGHPPLHPDHEDRGERTIPADGGVVLEPEDVPDPGDRVWLKGYACVRRDGDRLVVTDDDIEVVRSGDADVIHWAPAEGAVPVRMRTPDGDVHGVAEPDFAATAVDDVIQFERIGYVRVDDHGDDGSVVYWAHP